MIEYYVFMTFTWLAIAFVLWMPPGWLIMRFITPKVILDRYFKEPHFTFGELIWLSRFPGTLIRTNIFTAAAINPKWGKRRQMTDFLEYAPRWYVITARVFAFLVLGHGFLTVGLMIGLLVYAEFFDTQTAVSGLLRINLA